MQGHDHNQLKLSYIVASSKKNTLTLHSVDKESPRESTSKP